MGSLPPPHPDKKLPDDRKASASPSPPVPIRDTLERSQPSSLSPEQLEQYRQRIESGFYRSPEVIRHIAERVTDELTTPDKGKQR